MNNRLPLSLGILSLTACLAACGTLSTPSRPGGPQLRALTLGDVGGTVVSNLKNTSLEKYSGQQDLSKYDLLVVDGDTTSADTIKTHHLVRRALALHKPMLFVDVKEDHKRNGIGKLIGFNTKGSSDGYMVVPVLRPSGKTFYHMYITSNPTQSLTTGGSAPVAAPAKAALTDASDRAFAASLASKIADAQKPTVTAQDLNPSIQPVQQRWVVTHSFQLTPPATGRDHKQGQVGNVSVTYTYNLLQDLSTNLSAGGTQYLVVSTDTAGDPGPMSANDQFDKGWFVGDVIIQNYATNGDFGGMYYFKSGPIAEDHVSSYESGTDFNIGVGEDGPSGGFGWNSSQSHEIPDWSVQGSLGASNTTKWRFKSENPDIDGDHWTSSWDNSILSPNQLSTSLSEYHTEAVYTNNAATSGYVDLTSTTGWYLHNMWRGDDTTVHNWTYGLVDESDVSLNLSTVVPQQPTITYGYSTAPTNSTVTGSVILPQSAAGDTIVYLKATGTSNSGITVPNQVVIPAGSRVGSFPISINNDQTNTSVTVQADYGQYSAQSLLPVAQMNFTPPANNLTFDPNNWAAFVSDAPADSGWKKDNLVRYAISYIDGSGRETMGPYSSWFQIDQYALPYLNNLPTVPSGTVARRVYRQFYTELLNGTPGHVIKPDGNGNSTDTTYSTFQDDTW